LMSLIRSTGANSVREKAPAHAPATASRHWGRVVVVVVVVTGARTLADNDDATFTSFSAGDESSKTTTLAVPTEEA
jgi:hypothetical protein